MTTDIKQNYKIYIACIGAYNSGHLVGRWADLEHDNYDDVVKDIKAECLKSSKGQGYLNCYNCEELRIDDTDGPGGFYEFVNKFFINDDDFFYNCFLHFSILFLQNHHHHHLSYYFNFFHQLHQ